MLLLDSERIIVDAVECIKLPNDAALNEVNTPELIVTVAALVK